MQQYQIRQTPTCDHLRAIAPCIWRLESLPKELIKNILMLLLFKVMQDNSTLEFKVLSDDDIKFLCGLLDKHYVTALDLSESTISVAGIETIIQKLEKLPRIETLTISKLIADNHDDIAIGICRTTTIKTLYMTHCHVTIRGVTGGFLKNTSIEHLNLSYNTFLKDEGAIALASKKLKSLNLNLYGDSPTNSKYSNKVAVAFCGSKTLQSLSLAGSNLTDEAFSLLADSSNSITSFDLRTNKNTDKGMLYFATKTNLKSMDTSGLSDEVKNRIKLRIRINEFMPTYLSIIKNIPGVAVFMARHGLPHKVINTILLMTLKVNEEMKNLISDKNIQGLEYNYVSRYDYRLTPKSQKKFDGLKESFVERVAVCMLKEQVYLDYFFYDENRIIYVQKAQSQGAFLGTQVTITPCHANFANWFTQLPLKKFVSYENGYTAIKINENTIAFNKGPTGVLISKLGGEFLICNNQLADTRCGVSKRSDTPAFFLQGTLRQLNNVLVALTNQSVNKHELPAPRQEDENCLIM